MSSSDPTIRKCDHEKNRENACTPCGQKIVCGNKKISFFRISTKLEGLIVKFVDKKFSTCDPTYPVSICNTCRNTLNEHNKKKTQRPLP